MSVDPVAVANEVNRAISHEQGRVAETQKPEAAPTEQENSQSQPPPDNGRDALAVA